MTEDTKKFVEECWNCRYCIFDKPEQNQSTGKCHRYPPQVNGSSSEHPKVYTHSFCGEFKTRVYPDSLQAE